MERNVLLMLSSNQPPPPQQEVRWHASRCASHGVTHLVTTRTLAGLTVGESVVAFYGNADLNNQYLGRGVFLDYIPLDTPAGQQLLQSSPLYSAQGIPDNARAFIQLRDVQVAHPGEGLASLNGIIEASGLPLALANIPDGPARLQVYYHHADGVGG
jgi:hypothetical protein